ncbi:thioredoxin reductase 1, cytoplasmic isoform X2 [Lepeophtheirus salmonis]
MAPIQLKFGSSKEEIQSTIKQVIDGNVVTIFSKTTCPFCVKVKKLFDSLKVNYLTIELDLLENGSAIQQSLADKTGQRTVPNVFINGDHLGGADDTLKAASEERLLPMIKADKHNYDYDLVVIGGGSGGLSASKEAAKLGKKVAVCDFVKPSPQGTKWGLGGTCVNAGCIPKKLMHQTALLGEAMKDASEFGWDVPKSSNLKWMDMVSAIQNHIGSLNWGYRVQLRKENVTYLNAYASFKDQHTLNLVDKKGESKSVSAQNFIIATGGRPNYPKIPGAKEYGITSDDIFSLSFSPGKTLFVGASYIALECAGFAKGIGIDSSIMVRSILLRGFDQQIANMIGKNMEDHGIKFIRECVPTSLEQLEAPVPGEKAGLVKVCGKYNDGTAFEDTFNTVCFAIGRTAETSKIGLENIGVKLNPSNNKVIHDKYECTNIPNVYAIGDVLDGKPELTPMAIQSGKLLARRMFGVSDTLTDYVNVPTTVFTPLEYGNIGLSEEDAFAQYGAENIETYHSNFWPLEWTIAHRPENDCYAKLICLKTENERVVGFHYLGPNAGEVTQGFALGFRLGATKADYDSIIGIHPTTAENFTTLKITKSSGQDASASGC